MKRTFGKFEIQEVIGEGGFGRVFRAYDTALKRQVAIKTYTLDDPTVRQRFMLEAEIAAGLTHPNIVVIHDLGEHEGEPFIVQEYLAGEDLEAIIARRESLPVEEKLHYLTCIAEALAFAHGHGVIHRDIKPQNVRVLTNGEVRVLDFGIAKRAVEGATALTQAGASIGTIGYMAPEQLRAERIDHRVDIFSFGALAFELLTHEAPFAGDSQVSILYKLAQVDPTWPEGSRQSYPSELVDLVDRCLAKEPEDRPQSCGQVAGELRTIARMAQSERPAPAFDPAATRLAPLAGSLPPDPALGDTLPSAAPAPVGASPAQRGDRKRWTALGVAGVGVLAWALWLGGAIGDRSPDRSGSDAGENSASLAEESPADPPAPAPTNADPSGAPEPRGTDAGAAGSDATTAGAPGTDPSTPSGTPSTALRLDPHVALAVVIGSSDAGASQVAGDLISALLVDAGFTLRSSHAHATAGTDAIITAARAGGAGLAVQVQLTLSDVVDSNEFGMASAGATLTLIALDAQNGGVVARVSGQSTGAGTGPGMAISNAVRRAFEQAGPHFSDELTAWRTSAR